MAFKYPLASSSWDEAEYTAMQAVIQSGQFTMGERVREFERCFSNQFGSQFSVMVNSGSSANLLMVAALFYTQNPALKLQPGDEVIVPAVSWSTSYYPLHQYGLKLVFVDVDLETLNFDMTALAAVISERTRLILAVNLLGNPNDFTAIQTLISDRSIVLLEDNCESMGATYCGKQAGTFGIMGSFSTFFSHHISTMEGGVVVTDSEELYHILLALRAHGWTRNLPELNHITGRKDPDPFKESFNFVLPGYNVRPLELSGALGIEQLKKLNGLIENRRKNGAQLQSKLKNHSHLLIQRETGSSSWFGFSLTIRPESRLCRAELQEHLRNGSIEYRPVVAGNFTKNPVMQYIDWTAPLPLKNADWIDLNSLYIGNQHYDLTDAIDHVSCF